MPAHDDLTSPLVPNDTLGHELVDLRNHSSCKILDVVEWFSNNTNGLCETILGNPGKKLASFRYIDKVIEKGSKPFIVCDVDWSLDADHHAHPDIEALRQYLPDTTIKQDYVKTQRLSVSFTFDPDKWVSLAEDFMFRRFFNSLVKAGGDYHGMRTQLWEGLAVAKNRNPKLTKELIIFAATNGMLDDIPTFKSWLHIHSEKQLPVEIPQNLFGIQ